MTRKILIFKLIFFYIIFSFFNFALAYDDKTTHPALTDEIIDFYNLVYPDKPITPEQKEWIIEGSIKEDTPPRWINHFYDPIYKTGWTGEHTGKYDAGTIQFISQNFIAPFGIKPVSSIDWIHNNTLQAKYSLYEGIKTWDQAMLEIIKNNQKEAFKMLGHILHVLEDASVPDHTRNDTHVEQFGNIIGDYGSPYEIFASKYNRNNLNIAEDLFKQGLRPISKSTIDEYIISLAEYSNKYFFSKDTINDPKYQSPKIIREDNNFAYGKDNENKEFKLARVKIEQTENGSMQKNYFLNKDDDQILSSYFSRLSKQAVIYGAGAVKLFLDSAEIAKEYPPKLVLYDFSIYNFFEIPNISLTAEITKVINASKNLFSQIISTGEKFISYGKEFISYIFNNNKNTTEIPLNENPPQNQSNQNPNLSQDKNLAINQPQKQKTIQKQNKTNQSNQDELENEELFVLYNPNQATSSKNNEINNDEEFLDEEQNQNIKKANTSNNQNKVFCSFETNKKPTYQGVIINEVAWMGTPNSSNDEWIELKNISTQEINISNWQLIDKDNQIKINFSNLKNTKIKPGEFIILERTDDSTLPNIPADLIYVGALANTNEGLRLFDANCNLIDEVLANPNWPAGESQTRRTMERTLSLAWQSSNLSGGTPKAQNSVVGYGGGGGSVSQNNLNQATSSSATSQNSIVKVLISEIQVYPTNQRFIELYNPNDFDIDLTGYYLQRKTQSGSNFGTLVSKTYFEGKIIKAKSFFLISRELNPQADIVVSNLTLTNSNSIQLKNKNGDVIDLVGWGNASNCESQCAPDPQMNQSLQRIFENNQIKDTDNNNLDFRLLNCPSPKNMPPQNCAAQASQEAFLKYTNTNHIVISEILFNPLGSDEGKEFIELYNPTLNEIDLTNWTIKLIKNSQPEEELQNLITFRGNDLKKINPQSFLLIGFYNYSSTTTPPDAVRQTTLPNDFKSIILFDNNNNKIDEFNFEEYKSKFGNISEGSSIERKAYDLNCVIAQNENEFIGNGCDTNEVDDFFERQNPNPQNSLSLIEPRNPPEAENLTIDFDVQKSEMKISWGMARDAKNNTSTLIYKITQKNSSTTEIIFEKQASDMNFSLENFAYVFPVYELNKEYNYEFEVKDKDGLASTSSLNIFAESFIKDAVFFKNPKNSKYSLAIKLNPKHKFFDKNDTNETSNMDYQGIVFFLNQDPVIKNILSISENMSIPNSNQIKIYYPSCGPTGNNALIFPQNKRSCLKFGWHLGTWAYDFNQLEDETIIIDLDIDSSRNLTQNDYITLSFYGGFWGNLASDYFTQFVAKDAKKYYFNENTPQFLPPSKPQIKNFIFDENLQKVAVEFDGSTDPDTLDQNLIYEFNISTSTQFNENSWVQINTGENKFYFNAEYPLTYFVRIRAKDDFSNFSEIDEKEWSFPNNFIVLSQYPIKNTTESGNGNATKIGQIFLNENSGYLKNLKVYLSSYYVPPHLRWQNNAFAEIYQFNYDENNLENFKNSITPENKIAQSQKISSGIIDNNFQLNNYLLAFSFLNKPYLEKDKKYIWVVYFGGYGHLKGTCENIDDIKSSYAAYAGSDWMDEPRCSNNYISLNKYYFLITGENN
jgi:hypothetical protein